MKSEYTYQRDQRRSKIMTMDVTLFQFSHGDALLRECKKGLHRRMIRVALAYLDYSVDVASDAT